MKNWFLMLSVPVALMVLSTGAMAAPGPVTPVAGVEGKITTVDMTVGTVTIMSENGTSISLNVTDNTDIIVPGKESATISDLTTGANVESKYETNTNNALYIKVVSPKLARIQGQITSVSTTDNITGTMTIKPQKGDPVTLSVSGNTDLEIWNKELANIGDIKVGDRVEAQYDTSANQASQIKVEANQESVGARYQGIFGTVKAKTDTSLTVTTKQGDVILILNASTQYWDPPKKNATLADVSLGDRVAILAAKGDTTLLAKRVLVIPAKPVHQQVSGTVTNINGDTVTITMKDGSVITTQLPASLLANVKVGDVITVTLVQTPGTDKVVANGLFRSSDLQQRLGGFLDKVKNRKNTTASDEVKKSQDLDRLGKLLQVDMQREQDILQKAINKAPQQLKDALEKAKTDSAQRWQSANSTLEKARGERQPTNASPR
jgi:ribosomal protein L21E